GITPLGLGLRGAHRPATGQCRALHAVPSDARQSNALITTRRLRRLPGMCLHVSDDPLGDEFTYSLAFRPGFVVCGLPPALVGNLAENGRSVCRARLQSSDHYRQTVAAVLRYRRVALAGFFRAPLVRPVAGWDDGRGRLTGMYQAVPQLEAGALGVDRRPLVLTGGLLGLAAPRSESRARSWTI